METGSLNLGPLCSSFVNLFIWTIRVSPVKICPWFGSENGDDLQFAQGKLYLLSKMSFVSNIFINSLCLNILDRIVSVNVYTVEICSTFLNCVARFFFMFLPFIVLLMFFMPKPLFTKYNFINLFSLDCKF